MAASAIIGFPPTPMAGTIPFWETAAATKLTLACSAPVEEIQIGRLLMEEGWVMSFPRILRKSAAGMLCWGLKWWSSGGWRAFS